MPTIASHRVIGISYQLQLRFFLAKTQHPKSYTVSKNEFYAQKDSTVTRKNRKVRWIPASHLSFSEFSSLPSLPSLPSCCTSRARKARQSSVSASASAGCASGSVSSSSALRVVGVRDVRVRGREVLGETQLRRWRPKQSNARSGKRRPRDMAMCGFFWSKRTEHWRLESHWTGFNPKNWGLIWFSDPLMGFWKAALAGYSWCLGIESYQRFDQSLLPTSASLSWSAMGRCQIYFCWLPDLGNRILSIAAILCTWSILSDVLFSLGPSRTALGLWALTLIGLSLNIESPASSACRRSQPNNSVAYSRHLRVPTKPWKPEECVEKVWYVNRCHVQETFLETWFNFRYLPDICQISIDRAPNRIEPRGDGPFRV